MTTQEFLNKPYKNEDQMTADVHYFINHNFPQLRNFYFHIPNELGVIPLTPQQRSALLQRHMSCGVLPGVFDFCIMLPTPWYLELKMPGKGFNENQNKLAAIWRPTGIVVELADTKTLVVDYLMKHCAVYFQEIVRAIPTKKPKNAFPISTI